MSKINFKRMFAVTVIAVPMLAAAAAPVPAQILSAHKAFIANAGGEVNRMPPQCCGGYNGGPDRAYNQFYAAVNKSGQFELVSTPAEADLILEIRFKEPYVWLQDKYSSDPQLRLVVRDPKTNVVLWGLTEHIAAALLQGNRDKNFDQALDDLVARPVALRAGRVP